MSKSTTPPNQLANLLGFFNIMYPGNVYNITLYDLQSQSLLVSSADLQNKLPVVLIFVLLRFKKPHRC